MTKVLLVEDESAVREMLMDELQIEGYEVIEAVNGEDALKKLLAVKDVDVILSDRAMAVMSGYKLLELLRTEHPEFNDLPFIFMTALTDPRDKAAVEHLKPTAYIDKPIDFNLLKEKIDACTKKR